MRITNTLMACVVMEIRRTAPLLFTFRHFFKAAALCPHTRLSLSIHFYSMGSFCPWIR